MPLRSALDFHVSHNCITHRICWQLHFHSNIVFGAMLHSWSCHVMPSNKQDLNIWPLQENVVLWYCLTLSKQWRLCVHFPWCDKDISHWSDATLERAVFENRGWGQWQGRVSYKCVQQLLCFQWHFKWNGHAQQGTGSKIFFFSLHFTQTIMFKFERSLMSILLVSLTTDQGQSGVELHNSNSNICCYSVTHSRRLLASWKYPASYSRSVLQTNKNHLKASASTNCQLSITKDHFKHLVQCLSTLLSIMTNKLLIIQFLCNIYFIYSSQIHTSQFSCTSFLSHH